MHPFDAEFEQLLAGTGVTVEQAKDSLAYEAMKLMKPLTNEQFMTDFYSNEEGKCCVIGHWRRLKSSNPNDFSMENCTEPQYLFGRMDCDLRMVSRNFFQKVHGIEASISEVNNLSSTTAPERYRELLPEAKYNKIFSKLNEVYPQPEIKDRVMACLTDMVKAGF